MISAVSTMIFLFIFFYLQRLIAFLKFDLPSLAVYQGTPLRIGQFGQEFASDGGQQV
jgi:hypothetical protein